MCPLGAKNVYKPAATQNQQTFFPIPRCEWEGDQRKQLFFSSLLEPLDALRQHGPAPHEDMHVLWRRMVFNILISNPDDHVHNHSFLYHRNDGWHLSPAYDLNPVPAAIKPRVLSLAINEEDTAASVCIAIGGGRIF